MTDYAIPSEGGGDKLPLDDLNGALLRIEVLEALSDVQTVHGPANPVRANVAVLDGSFKAETFDDALIFPRVMAGQIRPSIGKVVLGRLGRGQAKPGKNAPWLLAAPTEADVATARKYEAYAAEKAAQADEPF